MLDLDDHPARAVPRRGLILEASIPHQRGVAGSASGPDEQVLDPPLQYLIGREPDGIGHVPPFQRLVQTGQRKGRVGSDDDGLLPSLVAINDGQEDLLPPVRTVDVARPKLGREAVALWAEDEERVVADGLKVAVVRGLLLRPVDGLSELSISSVTRRFAERAAACWIRVY